MEIIHRYLTIAEYKAVKMLAEEKSYDAIKRECQVTLGKCPTQAMPLFLSALRKKTGIENTRSAQEAQNYLRAYEQSLSVEPNDAQLDVLKRMAGVTHMAHSLLSLANNTGRTEQEAAQDYTDALASIGIFAKHASTRSVQMKLYFASRKPHVEPRDPITERQWEALRMFADGVDAQTIATHLRMVKPLYATQLIQSICDRLAIRSRGRGVQRKLARIAIAYHDAQNAPLTMDDAAFN